MLNLPENLDSGKSGVWYLVLVSWQTWCGMAWQQHWARSLCPFPLPLHREPPFLNSNTGVYLFSRNFRYVGSVSYLTWLINFTQFWTNSQWQPLLHLLSFSTMPTPHFSANCLCHVLAKPTYSKCHDPTTTQRNYLHLVRFAPCQSNRCGNQGRMVAIVNLWHWLIYIPCHLFSLVPWP